MMVFCIWGGGHKCGNDSTTFLGKYDGTTFSGLTPVYDDSYGGQRITCMAFYEDTLYVGGAFCILSSSLPISCFAKWDGYNLIQVNHEFGDVPCCLETMAVYKNELYIGGYFTKADGFTGNFIMKWDGHQFSEVGGGTNQRVTCMKVYNNELYVGGLFTEVGGQPCQCVAKWDGNQWTSLNSDAFDSFYSIRDLCIYNDDLYIAGAFNKIGNDSINNIAKFNHPLASVSQIENVESDLKVSPNPMSTTGTLKLPYGIMNATLCIYDVMGREVKRLKAIQNDNISLSREGMSDGVYFFEVTTGDMSIGRGKIVLN